MIARRSDKRMTESAHREPLTDLIGDIEHLRQEIDRAIDAGYPARDLMVVEYCAEPPT